MAHEIVTHFLTRSASGTDHIRVDGVSRSYADGRVLTDVSFAVARDARVGLIGENGSGKSTLLRIIGGRETPDAGVVERPGRVGLLWQELPFGPDAQVGVVLDDALAESTAAETEVQLAAAAVAAGQADAGHRLDRALREADLTDAWSAGARRASVAAGLGLGEVDDDATVAQLSGGQRSRLALAALLLARPAALLLDEPTNHLDDRAVEFLQRTLAEWPGPVLFASHDRAFLDQCATRIVDLDPAPLPSAVVGAGGDAGSGYGVQASGGGYSSYLEQRRAQRDRWQRQYELEQEELEDLRHQVAVTARTTNSRTVPRTEARASKKFYADRDAKVTSRRVRNAAVRLAGLEEAQLRRPPATLAFAGLPPAPTGAGPAAPLLVASEVGVEHRLAATTIAVGPGQKILVTGENGAGKSTLLHVLHGTLPPSRGSVHRAGAARTALLAQDVAFDDPSRSPRQVYGQVLGPARAEARPLATLGLVAGRDLDRPLGALSVGQQRRLALALVIADPPSVLLLDEPTNHLSLTLAEELEDALGTHTGAVVLASHDRWLRRRWRCQVLHLRPRSS
jgi:macrolide transport system ATP-binding/permease protein